MEGEPWLTEGRHYSSQRVRERVPDTTRPTTSLSNLLHAVTALLEGPLADARNAEDLHDAIGEARTYMRYNDLVALFPVPQGLDELVDNSAVDRLARELAMAVVEWLASDGDDDKFAVVDRLADSWRAAVIDGE